MTTAEQNIKVKIDAIINGLPGVQQFSAALKEIKTHGASKINLDTTAISKSKGEVGQLSEQIQKLAAAIENLDSKNPGHLAEGFHSLLTILTALAHVPAAFEGIEHLKDFVSQSPAVAAKLGVVSAAFRNFISGAREKGANVIQTVKTHVGELVDKLPKFTSGLAGAGSGLLKVGAAAAVAAGGVLAVVGPIALIIAAVSALVAIPAAGAWLLLLASSAADTGSKFHDLNQQTGVSVELLSSLAPVAADSNGSLEQLAQGIGRFNKLIGEAASGSREAKRDLKQFGLEPQEALANTDAALEKVIKRILALPPGTQQAIAAQKAFGKSGAELIPTLIATEGNLEEVKKKAQQLGVYWTGEGAAAADAYGDKLNEIKRVGEGLAESVGRTLIPELLKLARILANEMPRAGGLFSIILGSIAVNAGIATNAIFHLIAAAKTLKDVPGAIAASVAAGSSGVGAGVLAKSFKQNLDLLNLLANVDGGTGNANKTKGLDFSGGGGGGGKSKTKRELPDVLESVFGFNRAQAETAFNLVKDSLDRQEKALQSSFDKRKVSIKKFYGEELRIQTEQIDNEIAKLEALRKIEADREKNALNKIQNDKNITSEAERSAQLAIENNKAQAEFLRLDTEIEIKQRERLDIAEQLGQKEQEATRGLQDSLQSVIDDIDRMKGLGPLVDARTEIARLDEQIRELRLNGQNEAAALLEEWSNLLGVLGQLDAAVTQFNRNQQLNDARIATLQERGNQNLLQQMLSEIQINAIRKQQLADAEQLLETMLQLADAQKDPEILAAIERQRAAVARLKNQYQSTADIVKNSFVNGAITGLETLANSINDVVTGAKSIGDAFRDAAITAIQAIEQVIIKLIILKLIEKATKAFGGGSDGGGGLLSGGGSEGKAETGGWFAGKFAGGGPVFARPGGRIIQVAEGGHDEMVVTTDPRHALRSAKLLGRYIRRTGIIPKFAAGDWISSLSNIGKISFPRLAMGDFVSGDLQPAFGGGGTFQQVNNFNLPNVRNAREFRQSQPAIERDLNRAANQGIDRLRGKR